MDWDKYLMDFLLEEKQSMKGKVKILKGDLARANSEIVSKQNEIDALLAEVVELKSKRKRYCKFSNEKEKPEVFGHSLEREKFIYNWDTKERLAETILPKEMWMKIFGNIDNGLDLLNASWTCHHLYRILVGENRTTLLFWKVFSFCTSHLYLQDVLKCRLVCQVWRLAVNSYLEDLAKTELVRFKGFGSSPLSSDIVRAFRFRVNERDPKRFVRQFNSPTINPFITRSIAIEVVDGHPNSIGFRNGANVMLETFGRHIHHFKWEGANLSLDSCRVNISGLLHKLFQNAKNLQTLTLKINHWFQCAPEIIHGNMPSLPNLETLNIKLEPSPTVDWIYKHLHWQIKKLHLHNYFCLQGLTLASKFSWPEVTELGFSLDDLGRNEEDATIYLKYFESFPMLEKLKLEICWEKGLLKVLQIVQLIPDVCPRFHSLLLICEDNFASKYLKQIHHHPILFAPKELDTLEVELVEGEVDFGFLLRFPHIKKLSVACALKRERFSSLHKSEKKSMQRDSADIIGLRKCLKSNSNPLSSNVWRMLPNLETLQLQNKIYKRPKTSCPKRE